MRTEQLLMLQNADSRHVHLTLELSQLPLLLSDQECQTTRDLVHLWQRIGSVREGIVVRTRCDGRAGM